MNLREKIGYPCAVHLKEAGSMTVTPMLFDRSGILASKEALQGITKDDFCVFIPYTSILFIDWSRRQPLKKPSDNWKTFETGV